MQKRGMRRVITTAIVIVVIGFAIALGYRYWYEPTYSFVEVTDAQVTGNLTNVASTAGGQVEKVYFNVGDEVHKDDVVATIQVVSSAPTASAGPSVGRLLVRVTSPVNGRVALRNVSVGDTVSPGQPLLTLSDAQDLWVVADVGEDRLSQLAANQSVDVTLAGRNEVFAGQVVAIGSATTELVNPATVALTSSDETKKVPVRIAVDWAGLVPVPGQTADVIIHIQ